MKRYGLVLADNGSPWYFQGTADSRWSSGLLDELKSSPGGASPSRRSTRHLCGPPRQRAGQSNHPVTARRTASSGGHVGVVGRPVAHRDAQHGPVVPAGAGHPGRAVGSSRSVTLWVRASSPNDSADLREDDVVEHLAHRARSARPAAIAAGVPARPSTRSTTPVPPSERKAAQTGTPRARRESSGTWSNGSPGSSGMHQVARPARRAPPAALRGPRRPRSRSRTGRSASCARRSPTSRPAPRPATQVPQPRRRGGPEPEGAVDVDPGARLVGERRCASPNGSNAPECRLPACRHDDRRPVARPRAPSASASSRMRPCSSAATDVGRAQPEVAQCQVDRVVPLGADEHVHPRRTGQARRFDDPSRPGEHVLSRPAARPVKLAIVAPVTNPTSAPGGRPSRSSSQSAADLLGGAVTRGSRSASRCSGPRR